MKRWIFHFGFLGFIAALKLDGLAICGSLVEPPQLNVESPLEDVVAPAGQPVELRCAFFGAPQPKITWHHRGRRIDTHPSAHVEIVAGAPRLGQSVVESRLRIPCVDQSTAGEYFCEASSLCSPTVVTSAVVSVAVDIDGSKKNRGASCASRRVESVVAPWIAESTVNRLELSGGIVQLLCRVRGNPPPAVDWHRIAEDESLQSLDDEQAAYMKLSNGDLLVLGANLDVISESFRCSAMNQHGTAHADSTIVYMEP